MNIGNKIYFIGGISTKSRKVSAETFVYDIEHNSWKECDSLNTPRCKFSVTGVKNKIYVLGKINEHFWHARKKLLYYSQVDKIFMDHHMIQLRSMIQN